MREPAITPRRYRLPAREELQSEIREPAGYSGPPLRSRPPPATAPIDFIGSMKLIGALMSFARNAVIYEDGEGADYVYKVVSGTVRACRMLIDGRRQIEEFYLRGDIFGLETGDEHEFSAEAVGEATIRLV